jgi:hypothetical protein
LLQSIPFSYRHPQPTGPSFAALLLLLKIISHEWTLCSLQRFILNQRVQWQWLSSIALCLSLSTQWKIPITEFLYGYWSNSAEHGKLRYNKRGRNDVQRGRCPLYQTECESDISLCERILRPELQFDIRYN